MIRYEVTLAPQAAVAGALEQYMRRDHIPAIHATGCFVRIRFDITQDGLRTVYHAATREDLDRYFLQHAARFRADFQRHFPEGVEVSRAIWEGVESWPPDASR